MPAPTRAEIEQAIARVKRPTGVTVIDWPDLDSPIRRLAHRPPHNRNGERHGLVIVCLRRPTQAEIRGADPTPLFKPVAEGSGKPLEGQV